MGKAKMLGQNKPYTPNSRAATPGRKKSMVQQNDKHSDNLVKRYREKKEK